jgi:hypothetical protein
MLNRRKQTAINRLLVADTTRAIIAAPAAGFALRIFRVIATVVTAAAQQVDLGVAAGGVTKQVLSIPASATLPTVFESEEGFLLDPAVALTAVPVAAGPAVQFFVEYTVDKI